MNWDDLRILEVCVRNGSFLKASEELMVSHTSVSRRITQLENALNVTLLHRTSSGITPTRTGLSIIAQAREMADSAIVIRNTAQNTSSIAGKIRFETLDATAFNLMPYLNEFSKQYPEIEVDLRLDQQMANLDRGEADVVLRATNDPKEDYVGHHIGDHAFGIFGALDLVNQYPAGTPLSEFPWVLYGNGWSDPWMEKLGIEPRVVMRVSTAFGMIQAVRAGIGISHLACYSAALDERLLCLKAPTEDWNLQIWLLAHQSMRRNLRVKTFVKFLRQKITADRPLIGGKLGSPTRPLNLPYRRS